MRAAVFTRFLAAAASLAVVAPCLAQGVAIPAGSDPSGIAIDVAANRIYVANEFSHNVTVIDGATNATQTVAVGPRPQYIAVNPVTHRVYVSHGGDSSQFVIDPTTLAVTRLPTGGNGPFAINPKTNKIYMVRLGNNDEVTVINGTAHTWYSMAIDSYTPMWASLNPNTNKLFVASYTTGDVRIIDLDSDSDYPPTKSVGVWSGPTRVAVNPVTNKAYVIGENPRGPISVVDANALTSVYFVPEGHAQKPVQVAVNAVINKAYLVFSGEVIVVDGATNALTFVPAGTIGVAGNSAIAVNERTHKVYVTSRLGYMTVIDGTNNSATYVPVPQGANGVAVNPETNRVYVIAPAGVTVFNGATLAGTTTPPAGPAPNPPPPAVTAPGFNVQGLWWRATESGWGVNLAHQGDKVFATWFTYDANGNGLWLVMSNGEHQGNNTYVGTLHRTTGPAFSAPFDPARVAYTQVGSATFSFSDPNTGTLTATVNGVNVSKPITRLVFASPVPTCTSGGPAGAQPNYQDLWWKSPASSESGWGVNIAHQGDTLFATWYTYGADGQPMWLSASNVARTGAGTYTGTLTRSWGPPLTASPWDPSKVTRMNAGNVTFTFSDANNGLMSYTLEGVTQSKAITRLAFSTPATSCR
ncbi:MAG TPA: YncE family protein [Usitatibacter sp.]|nr:YncE family protein [Usitatibacter sp.]